MFCLGHGGSDLDIYCWLGGAVDCGGVKGDGNGSASWHENSAFHFWILTEIYRSASDRIDFGDIWNCLLLEDRPWKRTDGRNCKISSDDWQIVGYECLRSVLPYGFHIAAGGSAASAGVGDHGWLR